VGGWSMGGVSAVELAKKLRAQGAQVDTVILLDADYPHPDNKAYANPAQWNIQEMVAMQAWVADGAHLEQAQSRSGRCCGDVQSGLMKSLAGSDGFGQHTDRLKGVKGMKVPTAYRLMQLLSLHEELERAYEVEPYDGQVTLVLATDGKKWTDHITNVKRWGEKLSLMQFVDVRGTHASMTRSQNANQLASVLQVILDRSYGDEAVDRMRMCPGWWTFAEVEQEVKAEGGGYAITAAISPHVKRSSKGSEGLPDAGNGTQGGDEEIRPQRPGLWQAVRQAFNPFACQERIQHMVEEMTFTLVVTRCGKFAGAEPTSWILERSFPDFEMVRHHLITSGCGTLRGERPKPPELPKDPTQTTFGSRPSQAEMSKLLQGLDAFVRHVVKQCRSDVVVGNFLGTNRKFLEGGSAIVGVDSWEQHWSDKFKQVYYHNKVAKVTVWERPAGYARPSRVLPVETSPQSQAPGSGKSPTKS